MKSEQKPPQTALQKMQEIAERLTSNTPELMKCTAVLKQTWTTTRFYGRRKNQQVQYPSRRKGVKVVFESIAGALMKSEMTSNDYSERCK
jgi:hypothetical protein